MSKISGLSISLQLQVLMYKTQDRVFHLLWPWLCRCSDCLKIETPLREITFGTVGILQPQCFCVISFITVTLFQQKRLKRPSHRENRITTLEQATKNTEIRAIINPSIVMQDCQGRGNRYFFRSTATKGLNSLGLTPSNNFLLNLKAHLVQKLNPALQLSASVSLTLSNGTVFLLRLTSALFHK